MLEAIPRNIQDTVIDNAADSQGAGPAETLAVEVELEAPLALVADVLTELVVP